MPNTKTTCTSCEKDFYYKRDKVPDVRLSLQLKVLTNPGRYNPKDYNVLSIDKPIHLCNKCIRRLNSGSEDGKIEKILVMVLEKIMREVPGPPVDNPLNRFDVMDISSDD